MLVHMFFNTNNWRTIEQNNASFVHYSFFEKRIMHYSFFYYSFIIRMYYSFFVCIIRFDQHHRYHDHHHFFHSHTGGSIQRVVSLERLLGNAMPPRLPKMMLSQMAPSDEEVKNAQRSLNNFTQKELDSRKASLRAYLKQNPENANLPNALQAFLVLQSRVKDSQKKAISTEGVSTTTAKLREVRWMAQEEMDKTIGELKAAKWRESNLLPSRPDRITGATEDPFREYGIPTDWEKSRRPT